MIDVAKLLCVGLILDFFRIGDLFMSVLQSRCMHIMQCSMRGLP